ncbi:hypothetical protein EX30DRAFT_344885 [Ascodesmis nigricans]|uniref:Uncharacterized protein n=1 Tax=Ascodesmis nigricans TaxID=341454 RepID=A0A4V3SHJ4_9PEZI|nr:hypothetical protein EX30DRAFT_344885 [Ascodesmis nigricans]
MTGNFRILMHFPTSLPRSTGSPTASVHLKSNPIAPIQDVHSQEYDGPELPDGTPSNSKGSRSSRIGRVRNKAKSSFELRATHPRSRPGIPIFSSKTSQKPPEKTLEDDEARKARSESTGSLRSRLPVSVIGTARPRQSPKSPSPAATKAGSRRPEFKKIFSRRTPEPERPPSPADAAELHKMKQQLKLKTDVVSEPSSAGSAILVSPRVRLAAHFTKIKGKKEEGAGSNVKTMDATEDAKARLAEAQRRRKMRRVSSSTRSPDADESTVPLPVKDDSSEDEIHDTVGAQVGKEMARKNPTVQDHLEAHREVQEQEKDESAGGSIKGRMGNLAKRLSTTFSISPEEKDSTATRRPSRVFQSLDDRTQRNTPSPRMPIETSTSSDTSPHGTEVPDSGNKVSDSDDSLKVPPRLHEEEDMFAERYPVQQPPRRRSSLEGHYNKGRSRNPYMQVMYPPRPQGQHFRPTLSPVSSVQTNQHGSSHPRTRPNSAAEPPARRLSDAVQAMPEDVTEAIVQTSPSPENHQPRPKRPTVSRSSSTESSGIHAADRLPPMDNVLKMAVPLQRHRSKTQGTDSSNGHSQVQSQPTSQQSSMKDPSDKPIHPEKAIYRATAASKSPKSSPSPHQTQRSEQKSPNLHLPYRQDSISPSRTLTPNPLNTSARSPTVSALEFWQEADSSLHPSESASAQPPNYRGERPPEFWRLADATLHARHHEPTMDEWIATLPGLGLALGPYGTHDGTLDLRVFESLKAKRKLQKSRPSSSSSRKSAKDDLIDQSIHNTELALADADNDASETRELAKLQNERIDNEGLTPDEVEALKALDLPDNVIEGVEIIMKLNNTPPISDPRLLHPMYTPVKNGNILTKRLQEIPSLPRAGLKARPKSRLGKDVVQKLDALENYWNEQSVVMGTVLKRMLVVVDNLIVKEREEAQRRQRRMDMGWGESDDEEDGEEERRRWERRKQIERTEEGEEWGCSLA